MYTIRPASSADTEAMARVNVETRRVAYASIAPLLAGGRTVKEVASRWRERIFEAPASPGMFALVAEDPGAGVVGQCTAGPVLQVDPKYLGEVYSLYVLPAFQGRGLGHALLVAAARRLYEQGLGSLLIWVLAANAPARAFYTALGGRPVCPPEDARDRRASLS
jgi:ribosomal protein S18 acetylase RimI-like enzyme